MAYDDPELEAARLASLNDLLQLEGMAADELDYLGRLGELEDPDTDGGDCDHEERYGDEF